MYLDLHADRMRRESKALQRDVSEDFKRSFDKIGRDAATGLATGFETAAPRVQRANRKVADSTDVARMKLANLRLEQQKARGTANDLARAEDALSRARAQGITDADKLARLEKTVDAKRIATERTTARLTKAETQHAAALRDTADAHASLSGLTSNLNRVSTASSGAITPLAQLGQQLGALGKFVAPIGMGVLASGLIQVGGIAANLSQSFALLPGVLGSAAAGFGVFKLATAGFGDALDNLRDPEKFAESLRSLSPNAQQAATSIYGLVPAFDQLKNATQDALFEGVGDQLNSLASQYLPMVQGLTTEVAGAFNTMFDGLANELSRPGTQAAMQNFADNTAAAFQNLAPAIAPLTQAFAEIASVGSDFLPELASAAADAAEQFGAFIQEASRTGDLETFMSEGLEALKQIGSIAGSAGEAFMALAPLGRDILPALEAGMSTLADITPALVTGFTAWKNVIGFTQDAVTTLLPNLSAIGDVVGTVADFATGKMQSVVNAMNTMLEPIRLAIELANKLPGVDIPGVPEFSAAANGSAPLGGGPGASVERRGRPTTNAKLPAGTPLPGSVGAGALAGIGVRSGWGPSPFDGFVTGPDATGSSYGYGSGAKTPEGLVPNSANLKAALEQMFPGLQINADVGRKDSFGEHASGEALDIMVGNDRALGNRINQWLLANADAFGLEYSLWQQKSWDPSGTVKPMPDRGSPTANHMDHVHTNVKDGPAADGNYMPVGYSAYEPGAQRVTVDSFGSSASSTLQQTWGASLDQDFGLSRGLAGLVDNLVRMLGNIAMAPVLGALSGVTGAYGSAGPGTGILGAFAPRQNTIGSYGHTPGSGTPSMVPGGLSNPVVPSPGVGSVGLSNFSPPYTPPGSPGSPMALGQAGAAVAQGQLTVPGATPFGLGSPGTAATPEQGIAMGQGKPASPGIGLSGGGLLGMAGQAATMAAGMAGGLGGGGGGGAAAAGAQIGIDLINRTIGLAGQVAGIGVEGLMETFLPVGSELADPSRGWLGKIAGAVAGVRPAADNLAGKLTEQGGRSQPPLTPEQAEAKQASDRGKDAAQAAGAAGHTFNVVNNRQMNDFSAKDLAFYAAAAKNGR